jgi:glycosyltransferase involved in cell wall biosynthesis
MSLAPLLSIGIPLYRAAKFYDTIVANIDGIDYPNVEIIISDRHSLDDTIDKLDDRYKDDTRVTTYQSSDQLDWWDNYNFLVHQASGKYFRWLPQDDYLPQEGLHRLISRLEADADVILVYSQVETVDVEGKLVGVIGRDLRYAARHRGCWGYVDALGVVTYLHHRGAGSGIFRRDQIARLGLDIRPVPGGIGGTVAFRYALACHGRFEMVPEVVSRYTIHPGNYTAYTPQRWRNSWGFFRVARSFNTPGGSGVARIANDAALLVAVVLVRPFIASAERWTPRGRRAQRYLRSE